MSKYIYTIDYVYLCGLIIQFISRKKRNYNAWSNGMSSINKQLEVARQGLLDLTMRNSLLNFRQSKTKTMKIIDEIPSEIYNHLVIQEKKMEFLPKRINQKKEFEYDAIANDNNLDASNVDLDSEDVSVLWKMPEEDMDLEDKYVDKYLQTALRSEDLQKKLYYISKQAHSALEEQGHTILYLALGYLEWNDPKDTSQMKKAPLVLLPVELTRKGVGGSFQLSWTGEDVFTNISLQTKLGEYNISFPDFQMPDEKEGINAYYQEVTDAVKKKPEWKVLSDINLGFFSFTKFIMYKDLDPVAWPKGNSPAKHPLIKEIFNPDNSISDNECSLGFSEKDVDTKLKAKDIYHVMDADPSQIAVIEDVKSGMNLVVEGPPGTGKSQTITNIIAELLASGKTVLFVSEKMAALEVVKSRLDQTGIGDFCLELHSKKANKKEVLKELERTLNLSQPKSVSLNTHFSKLESLKSELNDYASALREPFANIGRSPFDLFCMKEDALRHFEKTGIDLPPLILSNVEECSQQEWSEAIDALTSLSEVLPLVTPINSHQWNDCNPGIVLPSDELEIEGMINDCKTSLDNLTRSIGTLSQLSSVKISLTLKELESSLSASDIVAMSNPIEKEILLNERWDNEPERVTSLISKVDNFNKQNSLVDTIFKEEAFDENIDLFIEKYSDLCNKYSIVPFFDSTYLNHPWKASTNNESVHLDSNEIESLIDNCKESLFELESSIEEVCEKCSIHQPFAIEEISSSISAARVVAASKPVDKKVLLNKEWNEQSSKAESLIKKVQDFQKQKENLESTFSDNAFEQDIDSITKEYKELSAKFFIIRVFNGRYRYLKNEINSFYKGIAPKKTEIIISDLNDLYACLKCKKEINESNDSGQSLFGSHWKEEDSDPQMLTSFSDWIVSFRQQLLKDAFNDQVVDKVSSGISRENVEELIEKLNKATENFIKQRDNLASLIGISPNLLFSSKNQKSTFEDISLQLEQWKHGIVERDKWINSTKEFYISSPPEKAEDIIFDLNELLKCITLKSELRDLNEEGFAFFGHHWKCEQTELQTLNSFEEWILSFRQCLSEFKEDVFENISSGISKDELKTTIKEVTQNADVFTIQCDKLFKRLGLDYELSFASEFDNLSFEFLDSQLQLWKEAMPMLQNWGQFTIKRDACLDTFASPIIDLVNSDQIEYNDIVPCFEGVFAENLLRCAFRERKTLAGFIGELHEKKIDSFTELDRELILENRQRLARLLYEKQPSIYSGASPGSELGILLGEFNRKRKHMPIRQLMRNTGGLIQKIKPCFMMSPLSIAQFLDPVVNDFDVVVFDEASQVKPEDALGALLRAKQCVIIGDTRQLPPTSFFDKMLSSIEDNEEEGVVSVSDIESILHLCKRSFPIKNLRWHYRSRHESLIAVSNEEFYEQNLVIYPSPMADMDNLGLKFVHLPDTVYKSSMNRKEAKAVAKAAFEHFNDYPEKSLGIGTFNVKQQQAIQEEVDILLMQNPEMNEFFDNKRPDHFFVKNLETIQGDERDVIFISTGYGFDENRKFRLNFGPLNKEGGERRLNVLITRAREKCVVFSNFKATDLNSSRELPVGVKALKVFMDFAENRTLSSVNKEKEQCSSFEKSVYDFLCDCGYKVEKKVGCAGYLVDMAIVDSKCQGRYILGIECDADKYHSSHVARDRDRLSQQILENLEWKVYRVWSTDWYRNRKGSQTKLKSFIDNIIETSSKPLNINKKQLKSQIKREDTIIERKEIINTSVSEKTPLDFIPEYEVCTTIDIDTTRQIPELSHSELERAIIQILEVESPVHLDDVIKRLRENHGIKRTGNKIKDAIFGTIDYSQKRGNLSNCNGFLWLDERQTPKVRQRGNGVPAKIEMICDEEISEAIKLVLKTQHATSPDELATQTSRLFGIRSTSEMVAERIKSVMNSLLNRNHLRTLPNGMIDIAEI
ncbi:DUF3320 domain-containing protein [Methanolobus sp. WCC1]|jgi:superfamily I DNA and/or RNA helicase|uniref:DUF3320 domain-containing protein n=1 Tax=unclassified Methanolobus TaxID=2629569 RepID=UPI00258D21F1|nr:DUF3320 domain-containing protein [Methanolobus sp.]MDK2831241.1 hypothetical protein [Methanolobus sp.]